MQFVRARFCFKPTPSHLLFSKSVSPARIHLNTICQQQYVSCRRVSTSKTKLKTSETTAVSTSKRGKKKEVTKNVLSQEELGDDKAYAEYDATLSQEQRNVLSHVINGKNVFFTGSAGTGKSYLLQAIKRELSKRSKSVSMTASTGIAAVNVGGITLHKWAGLGIRLSTKISKEKRKNWLSTDVLVIDEISMISDRMFDHIDTIAKEIRGNDKPFGGIQIVCVGDFFQLPPVSDGTERQGFCFESKSWREAMHETIQLNEIYRQHDPEFIRILNEIRIGKVSEKTKLMLDQSKHHKLDVSDGIYPTVLYSRNMHVDKINDEHLNKLTGKIVTFASYDKVTLPQGLESTKQRLWSLFNTLDGCLAATTIQLKLNAQVMLLRNISKTLINGSRGVVVDFVPNTETNPAAANPITKDTDKDRAPSQLNASHPKWITKNKVLPVVRFSNGEQLTVFPEKFTVEVPNEGIAERIQIPLKLAYAMTIHKSQGLTIDKAQMSLSDVFECGQAYVALSRLRSLKGFHLLDWDPKVIKAHPKVLEFYTTLNQKK